MRIPVFAPVLAAALALAACEPPESTQPLSAFAGAKADPRLSGTFTGRVNDADCFVHLMPGKGATTDLVLVVHEKDKGAFTLHWQAFATTVGGKSYLNLQRKTFPDRYAEKFDLSPGFIFARYELEKDGSLTLWTMQEDPLKAAIAAHTLDGVVDGDNVKLRASSAKLAAFVEKSDAKLFKRFGSFRRL
jgi:hypothetical protein